MFEENIARLNDLERRFRLHGYKVVNPVNLIEPTGLKDDTHRETIMNICFAVLKECDAIVLCGDISMGVAKELTLAEIHGLDLYALHQFPEVLKEPKLGKEYTPTPMKRLIYTGMGDDDVQYHVDVPNFIDNGRTH